MSEEGHKHGRDGVIAYRREVWEETKETSKGNPFCPKCPHCKKQMPEMVAMPVYVARSGSMPVSYLLCCWWCQTIIDTVTGTDKTWDHHNKLKGEQEDKDKLKEFLNYISGSLNSEVIEELVSHINPETMDNLIPKIRGKISEKLYQGYLIESIKER